MRSRSVHSNPDVQQPRCPRCCRQNRGSLVLHHCPGYCNRYGCHGVEATGGETAKTAQSAGSVARKEDRPTQGVRVLGRHVAACKQSHSAWLYLHASPVRSPRPDPPVQAALLSQAKRRMSSRHRMVEHLYTGVEWDFNATANPNDLSRRPHLV